MHNLIHYKEYYGRLFFSSVDKQYVGKVKNAGDSGNMVFKGNSEEEVKKAFKDYIDELSSSNNLKKG